MTNGEPTDGMVLLLLYLIIVGLGTNIKWIIKFIRFILKSLLSLLGIGGNTKQVTAVPKQNVKPKPQQQTKKVTTFPGTNKNYNYYQSTYYLATKTSYDEVVNDLGRYGEYLIFEYLKDYELSGGRFLFNCYIPTENNQTTEIDVMMVHQNGIFVFESKNYSGWIFGNETDNFWTQVISHKRGESSKEQFFNPIKQNAYHIEHLKKIVGNYIPIYSVIVFSERCSLKKITLKGFDIKVIKRDQISRTVSSIMLHNEEVLIPSGIIDVYNKLYPYTQVSEEVKQQHIKNLQQNKQVNEVELPFL